MEKNIIIIQSVCIPLSCLYCLMVSYKNEYLMQLCTIQEMNPKTNIQVYNLPRRAD